MSSSAVGVLSTEDSVATLAPQGMEDRRVAVVTGASRGIGREIAVELARAGFSVVAAARTRNDLDVTLERLSSIDPGTDADHMALVVDVCVQEDIRRLFSRVMQRCGRIDVLVNNAGFVDPVGLLELSIENWNQTLDTNLTAAFLCTREFVRLNKTTGGKIINIASTAGMSARPGWSAYAAAKSGLINFSLTMSEELKSYDIKVYCVCPGRTATDLRTKLAPNEDPSTILQPAAVAELVRFLAQSGGDYLDQQAIVIRRPIS